MKIEEQLKECLKNSEKAEKSGIKHKGLLLREPNDNDARVYIEKAKRELELCDLYRERGFDYKIPEEWFYTLYYCALAILSKFGIESRSQKYTALFLEYAQEKGLINYEKEFIKRITVFSKIGEESEVDKREEARYSPSIKIAKVEERYEETTQLCKEAIAQAEEIVFSTKEFKVPRELYE
ncbi:MAG: hypothetical protein WCP89_02810 [archaeon]